jgi:predicted NBD/HSP70 family sugar kinase
MARLPEKATHQQTRTFNQQLVLRAIYDRAEISRAEVARVTGLTRTSVSALVGELLRDGLVEEVGRGPSTGGKAPILVRLRPDGRHAIGLDLGEAFFSGALVDLRGGIVNSARLALEGRNGAAAVEVVIELIEALINRNGASPLLGIGIGTPGIVDSKSGTVRWSGTLDWADVPLGGHVEKLYGVPVVVANDAQAAAVAESTFEAHHWPANFIVVRVGRGIGAGVILNGSLFQGDGSGAGEIGHLVIGRSDANDRPELCHCGRSGCLETVASMNAMVRDACRVDPTVTDAPSLIKAFKAGNEDVRQVVLRAGEALGDGIAAFIATLNVQHVLLIGPATGLGERWLAAIRRRMEVASLPLLARETVVELGRTRDDDVVIGASALLMTRALGLSLAR